MSPSEALVQALTAAARKRRLLSVESAKRLTEYAQSANLQSVDDLQGWLDQAKGLSADLAKRLRGLLPSEVLPTFGTWTAIAHLADGGMGRVWMATNSEGALAVVKTVKSSASMDPGAAMERRQRFERELSITQRLEHQNIVRCLDAGSASDGTLYIALEFIDTGDLRDLVESRKKLPELLALAVVYQIADALAEAHRLQLIHRDLKPSNIFVANDGRAKLADFGLARSVDTGSTRLTMAGALVGSPHYMSPEQVIAEGDLDGRSDLYALGCVLFYCVTGRPPFEGKVQEVLRMHCQEIAPDPRSIVPEVSENTATLLASLLSKDPDQRPANAGVLAEHIEAMLAASGATVDSVIEEETHTANLLVEEIVVPAGRADDATIVADLSGKRGEAPAMTDVFSDSRSSGGSGRLRAAILTTTSLRREDPPQPLASAPSADDHGHSQIRNGSIAIQKVAASLLAGAAEEPKTVQVERPSTGSGSSDLAPVDEATGARKEPFAGDITRGIAEDWLMLTPESSEDVTVVHLWARARLVLGKLKEAPVDLCLRNYPVAKHKESLQKISRQHLAITFDRIAQQVGLTDLGTANGSLLDGEALHGERAKVLSDSESHVLMVASAVSLWLRARKARTHHPVHLDQVEPDKTQDCGLEVDHAVDAVLITRPENRAEMVFAQVLRRVTIGGPGSDLALVGARSLASVEIARYSGHWVWRRSAETPWAPLAAGDNLDCGGRRLLARPGGYDGF